MERPPTFANRKVRADVGEARRQDETAGIGRSRSLRRRRWRRTALGVLGAFVAVVVVMFGAQSLTAADQTPDLGPAVRVGTSKGTPSVPPSSAGPTSAPASAGRDVDRDRDGDRDGDGDSAVAVTPGPVPTAGEDSDDSDDSDEKGPDRDERDDDGGVGHDAD